MSKEGKIKVPTDEDIEKLSRKWANETSWMNADSESYLRGMIAMRDLLSTPQLSESEWISVDKRLPEKYCQCLIYCPTSFPKNSRVLSANYYDDDKQFYCDAFEVVHEDVTHWMPLPKAPIQTI